MCHLLSMLILTIVLGSRTNLVIKEGLPEIFEQPRNLAIVSKSPCFNLLRKGPQTLFNVLELAGRKSGPGTTWGNGGVRCHFTPTAHFFHITWIGIEFFFQLEHL
jgi:hypothetical protein